MGRPIDRINAMITRAKQHIQDFHLGLQAFNDTNPYEFAVKDDTQTSQHVYYISKADCVPDSLTAIAADVIQNLRSPLDHIAYQLVLAARGGTEPDWLVYYPITREASDYKATRSGKIKGVRQEVIDAIDATEPYKGGKGHVLWQLNELNKLSKHQLLIGAGGFFSGVDVSGIWTRIHSGNEFGKVLAGFDFQSLFVLPADKLFSLKVGDELYREPIDLKVDYKMPFRADVAFDKPGVIECEPALKTLQDMANLISDIVPRLGQLLP